LQLSFSQRDVVKELAGLIGSARNSGLFCGCFTWNTSKADRFAIVFNSDSGDN